MTNSIWKIHQMALISISSETSKYEPPIMDPIDNRLLQLILGAGFYSTASNPEQRSWWHWNQRHTGCHFRGDPWKVVESGEFMCCTTALSAYPYHYFMACCIHFRSPFFENFSESPEEDNHFLPGCLTLSDRSHVHTQSVLMISHSFGCFIDSQLM